MPAAERESRAFLQVGLHMRYRRLYRYIKDFLDAGRLGNLKMVWCQEFRGDWNPEATHFDDGKGVHRDRGTIDHADISIEYENGVWLNLSMCMFASNRRFKGRYIGFIGDQAVLDF